MNIDKNRLKRGMAVGLACLSVAATAAVFTDRYESNATAKAGSVDLKLTETWQADNAETISHFAPGDYLSFQYSLENDSTLAAKVRETIVITSDKQIPADTFRIYKLSDLEKNTDTGIWSPKAGKSPVATLTDTAWDGTKMYSTYKLPQFVLDGSHQDQSGVATATPNTDTDANGMVYANTSENDQYVILFNGKAETSVAGANIGVEYLAEAMQHSGTGTASETAIWEQVVKEEITITGVEKAADDLTFDPLIP